MKPFKTLFAVAVLALVTATPPAFAAGEVNLYSARKEELIKPLLDRFSAATGIKVNLVTGKADALLKRLESEGRNTPADLLLTTDAGRLYRAYEATCCSRCAPTPWSARSRPSTVTRRATGSASRCVRAC